MTAALVTLTIAALGLALILAFENAMLRRELEQARRREMINA